MSASNSGAAASSPLPTEGDGASIRFSHISVHGNAFVYVADGSHLKYHDYHAHLNAVINSRGSHRSMCKVEENYAYLKTASSIAIWTVGDP